MNADDAPSAWISAFGDADPMELPKEAIRPPNPDRAPYTANDLHLPETMGGADPAVSVIIPTYEDTAYLPDALESVGAQTFDDLEIVLVDSSGKSWVRELADERQWIRYLSVPPRGVSAARNDGLSAVRGSYAAFLDADDYWHPAKLEYQLSLMTDESPIGYTGYHFLNYWNDREPIISLRDVSQQTGEDVVIDHLTRKLDSHISTVLCRTDILPDRPFNERLSNFEDVLFTIELFREHQPVSVSLPLAVRRLRLGSITDQTDEIEKSRNRIRAYKSLGQRYFEYASQTREMIALETYRMGIAHLKSGEITEARLRFRESLRTHPAPAKAASLYLLTFIPFDPVRTYNHLETLLPSAKRRTVLRNSE